MPPKIAEVIENEVCTACGTCEAMCPIGGLKKTGIRNETI